MQFSAKRQAWREDMRRRLGRRGGFLLAWGILFALYGIGLFVQPLPNSPHATFLLHEMAPSPVRAVLWLLTGLVAIRYAFAHSPARDIPGFAALGVMPTIRMASYGVAWVAHLVLGGSYGDSRGWVSAIFYAVFVTTVVLVAGWAERSSVRPTAPGLDADA